MKLKLKIQASLQRFVSRSQWPIEKEKLLGLGLRVVVRSEIGAERHGDGEQRG
jgi:hypothetical protein